MKISAIAVYFVNGVAGMIANIATLTLAAEHCPERVRGLRLRRADVGHQPGQRRCADTIGAFLYEHRVRPAGWHR